jgi:hypothetical protein
MSVTQTNFTCSLQLVSVGCAETSPTAVITTDRERWVGGEMHTH